MIDVKSILTYLLKESFVSGREEKFSDCIRSLLPPDALLNDDKFGNTVVTLDGNSARILLTAHCDEIGLVVTEIDKEGFVHVSPCGGVDRRVLINQDLIVHGKTDIFGVVASIPPHLVKSATSEAADYDNILVDCGMKFETVSEIVSVGDRISFKKSINLLENNTVSAPSLDNKAGCAALISVLHKLSSLKERPSVTVLFTNQEETGGAGAVSGAYNLEFDRCICVDVSFGSAPGVPAGKSGVLGKGPMIGFAPVLNYNFSNMMVSVAERFNIPYQKEIMSDVTGTDSDKIAVVGKGSTVSLISIPEKNMHTAVEIVSIADIENTAELIFAYLTGEVK